MRFKSLILAQASGSTGGLTYSHNAGGMYVRQRTVPTDPNTAAQAEVRAAVASLVNHWVDTLTQVQRDAWNVYAANVPLNDVFGDPRFRSGINHYVRSNVGRLQHGAPRVDAGPVIFNLGEFSEPWFEIDVAGTQLKVNYTVGDAFNSEDGAYMFVHVSVPKNPTINFFKGPYVEAGRITGDSAVPPASPALINWPHVFAATQKGFFRVNVSRADGRLSTPFRGFCIAA